MVQKPASLLPSAAPALACLAAVLASGCAVGPDYHKPVVATPAAFKEAKGWKAASPGDTLVRGKWWEIFNDPVLNALEEQAAEANPTVQQAAANYDEARQVARSDRTQYLPTISANASAQRTRTPDAQRVAGEPSTSSLYNLNLEASWEPDLWGRIRRTVEADVANAQAGAADLESALLAAQAAVAEDYVALRASDDKIRLLENAVGAYQHTLEITRNKYAVGVAARSDVITAQTQLDSTRAQLIAEGVTRAQLEHAVAVLLGKMPADFSIARRAELGLTLPEIPLQLPSELLERRPDVAAAERLAQVANAKIGIQTAAYFPSIGLSAEGGFEGGTLDKILSSPYRFWTLGAQAADDIIDWGQRHDLVLSARAAYEASAANYRQTVLTAFQQVEDNLAAIRILSEEAKVQDAAVSEATLASQIALNEYNAGTVDFTTVATAQVTELTNRETALGIIQDQLTAGVTLIQALGGGWTTADLPSAGQVVKR